MFDWNMGASELERAFKLIINRLMRRAFTSCASCPLGALKKIYSMLLLLLLFRVCNLLLSMHVRLDKLPVFSSNAIESQSEVESPQKPTKSDCSSILVGIQSSLELCHICSQFKGLLYSERWDGVQTKL